MVGDLRGTGGGGGAVLWMCTVHNVQTLHSLDRWCKIEIDVSTDVA